MWLATALKKFYEGEIGWLERLLQVKQAQNDKVAHLKDQLAKERVAA